MPLKTVIEAEADVPEGLKEFYKADGKVFVLDLEGLEEHPKVRGLSTANKENARKRDEMKAKLSEAEERLKVLPEDFDPEKYQEMKAQVASLDPNDPNNKKIADEHIQSMKAVYEKKIENASKKAAAEAETLRSQLAERDSYIDRTVVDGSLKDSLLEVGVQPELLEGALAALKPSVKVKKMDDGNRKPIVETDLGEIDVSKFVGEWAGTKGKAYLGKPSGPGPRGNSGTQNGAKVMSRDDFNKLTPAEQMTKMNVDHVQLVDTQARV